MLVIAGYDPSGGAGILADVKTAESHCVYAQAVCTGFTFQNTRRITRIHWFTEADIREQIALCYEETTFSWVKIGITRHARMLAEIIGQLKQHNASVKIVWDPVLAASSGTRFMEDLTAMDFEAILPGIFLVTPNLEELRHLYPGRLSAGNIADDALESVCLDLSDNAIIYLKGGHDNQFPGRDRLFRSGELHIFPPGPGQVFPKHGSGCVFSSALTASLAKGYPPLKAAQRSKRYTERFLNSHPGLLGRHDRV